MNPETEYPELKSMKASEVFIEWACIVKGSEFFKVYIKKLIAKKDTKAEVFNLKKLHNSDDVYLCTITK